MLMGQMLIWGHLGSLGSKGHFHLTGIKSYKILSIDACLMHMHKFDPLYKSYDPKNASGVIWGHRGQKIIFNKKASSLSKNVALMSGLRTCISLTPSTKVIVLKINPGSFGVTGVKRSFSLKCYNSSVLHSMTIRLICLHQLETLYLCCGVKCQSGVLWGHWGQ